MQLAVATVFNFVFPNVFLKIRLIDDTLGRQSRGQIPSYNNRSLISQANIVLFSSLYCFILLITKGVDTRGLLPPESH